MNTNSNSNPQPITLTAENFAPIVLQSDRLVLVDFWASWCGPCRVMNPIVTDLATEAADWLTVAKLDVDEWGDLASTHHVQAIPTLIAFQNGVEVQRWTGVVRLEPLRTALTALRDTVKAA
ncbi:MAG: thioredoxin [Spirulinaceae cyanobacterium SM2_1_0]|nr:thioredoxin [Spirulinaceae cyanobacterium SM2_1_0]